LSRKVQPIHIYGFLPKRNCGKCGVTTCLAFAAKLASGEATPDLCPFLTPQSRARISALIMPPVRPVAIASSKITVEVGGEEGLFRHDGGFRREARIAYPIDLTLNHTEITGKVSYVESIVLERMDSKLSVDLYIVDLRMLPPKLVEDKLAAIRRVTDKPLILKANSMDAYDSALKFLRDEKPAVMIDLSTISIEELARMRSIRDYPIVIMVDSIDPLEEALTRIEGMGLDKVIIGIRCPDVRKLLKYVSSVRVKGVEGDRKFGYPILVDVGEATHPYGCIAILAAVLLRYASILVLPRSIAREGVEGLLVFKQSLYMDPKKPRTVDPGLYEVGMPSRSSPVIVTSNYALTFYIVRKALEVSGIGCWILAVDTGGLSVASAIGGGKFTAKQIVEAIQAHRDRIDPREVLVILPGLASHIKPEIEAVGFNVVVGPIKARDIPVFVKSLKYGESSSHRFNG